MRVINKEVSNEMHNNKNIKAQSLRLDFCSKGAWEPLPDGMNLK